MAGSAPELGKVEGTGAVAVGLLHGDQYTLLDIGIVVGVVDLQLDFQGIQLIFGDEFGLFPLTRTVSVIPGIKKMRPTWGLSIMLR